MRSRRALFGLLAGGAAAATSWSAARACSIIPETCASFRSRIGSTQAMIKAYVFESEDASLDLGDGRWLQAVRFQARTTEVIVGPIREGRVFSLQTHIFDCNGYEIGHLPEKGETVIIRLLREKPGEDWSVDRVEPIAEYERWLERCRV